MELAKLGLPKEENIVTRNKFIANNVLPIAFKPTNVKNRFLALFVAIQDIDESCIYLQSIIAINNKFELDYIMHHELNIANMTKNSKTLEAYQNMIKNMTNSNIYATDFIMNDEKDFPLYYHSLAIKAIDQTHASVLDLYFNRDYFIKINLYLNRLANINKFSNNHVPEALFNDPRLHNIEFVQIEKIKHDATARIVTQHGTININHYTMWCGPSVYKMNYLSPIDKDHTSIPLSNPLDINLYNAFYESHTFIDELITYNDQVFLLYEERSEITKDFKSMKALKLSKELVDKTNFLDSNNMIYDK